MQQRRRQELVSGLSDFRPVSRECKVTVSYEQERKLLDLARNLIGNPLAWLGHPLILARKPIDLDKGSINLAREFIGLAKDSLGIH